MGARIPHKSISFNSNNSSSKEADGAAPAFANGAGADGGAAQSPSANGEGANGTAAHLEKKVKKMEECKTEAQKEIFAAQAGKKDDASKAVPISACWGGGRLFRARCRHRHRHRRPSARGWNFNLAPGSHT